MSDPPREIYGQNNSKVQSAGRDERQEGLRTVLQVLKNVGWKPKPTDFEGMVCEATMAVPLRRKNK